MLLSIQIDVQLSLLWSICSVHILILLALQFYTYRAATPNTCTECIQYYMLQNAYAQNILQIAIKGGGGGQ